MSHSAWHYSVRWKKKQDTLIMSITAQNINRFSKFFHYQTQHKSVYKMDIRYPTSP